MLQDYLSEYKKSMKSDTELRAQKNTSQSVFILKGNLTTNSSNTTGGVSARIHKNGLYGFASSSEYNRESVDYVLKSAINNTDFLNSRVKKMRPPFPAVEQRFFPLNRDEHQVPQKYLIDFAKELDAYISTHYKKLDSRSISCRNFITEKLLYTTDSYDSHTYCPRSTLYIDMTANDTNAIPISLGDVCADFGVFDELFYNPQMVFPKIDALYERLMKKREGIFPEGGIKQVILDPDLTGILAHEAVGHTVEGDLVLAGSIAGSYLHKPVASELVTLVDFAHTYQGKQLAVPVYVDDEGTKAEDTVLIENGILKNYMHSKETAAYFDAKPLGNARAYEFSDEPLVRMRNTAILPGKDTLEDMIASVDDGYYLMNPSNGEADLTGEFMFGTSMGYEIKHGKLGRALKETTISGIAFDMLKTVDMVSNDLVWKNSGWCGKKQMIPVSIGGPAIKCKINVGGK